MTRRECEVLVVGGGPAGIAAACCSSESGRKVILADENPAFGGQIWRTEPGASNKRAERRNSAEFWLSRLARCGASVLPGAAAFDADAKPRFVRFEREHSVLEIHYDALVIATGARERFLPFPGWTLPGVYGAGGLQALAKGGFPVRGRRIVVAGTGPLLMAAAGMLGEHGADILMVLEQANWRSMARFGLKLAAFPGKLLEAARLMAHAGGVPFRPGWWVCEAGGDGRLEWVTLTNGERASRVDCEMLACGYGLVPNSELARFLGCRIAHGGGGAGAHVVEVDGRQRTSVESIFACGEVTGIGGAELSLVEGSIAGYAACGHWSELRRLEPVRERYQCFAREMETAFALRAELRGLATSATVVCRCEDVTTSELSEFGSWREAKLAARCGMGPCQARTCGPAVEFLLGWRAEGVRPPITTVRLGSFSDQNGGPGGA
jgi:D-hydroxyproline dehydrogenase subunit alpha